MVSVTMKSSARVQPPGEKLNRQKETNKIDNES
jgi:hypothetical protein